MALDFVAIDFETANPKRASVIQIGLARVRDGVIGKTTCKMVYPPPYHDHFHPRNIAVHGLTMRDLKNAPYWLEIHTRLVKFANGLPLVAHNAPFERSVINSASEACGFDPHPFEYLCSQKLAKTHLPDLTSYRLNDLTAHLGLPEFSHHDAGDDAVACAKLVLAIAEHTGHTDLTDLWPKPAPRRNRYVRN